MKSISIILIALLTTWQASALQLDETQNTARGLPPIADEGTDQQALQASPSNQVAESASSSASHVPTTIAPAAAAANDSAKVESLPAQPVVQSDKPSGESKVTSSLPTVEANSAAPVKSWAGQKEPEKEVKEKEKEKEEKPIQKPTEKDITALLANKDDSENDLVGGSQSSPIDVFPSSSSASTTNEQEIVKKEHPTIEIENKEKDNRFLYSVGIESENKKKSIDDSASSNTKDIPQSPVVDSTNKQKDKEGSEDEVDGKKEVVKTNGQAGGETIVVTNPTTQQPTTTTESVLIKTNPEPKSDIEVPEKDPASTSSLVGETTLPVITTPKAITDSSQVDGEKKEPSSTTVSDDTKITAKSDVVTSTSTSAPQQTSSSPVSTTTTTTGKPKTGGDGWSILTGVVESAVGSAIAAAAGSKPKIPQGNSGETTSKPNEPKVHPSPQPSTTTTTTTEKSTTTRKNPFDDFFNSLRPSSTSPPSGSRVHPILPSIRRRFRPFGSPFGNPLDPIEPFHTPSFNSRPHYSPDFGLRPHSFPDYPLDPIGPNDSLWPKAGPNGPTKRPCRRCSTTTEFPNDSSSSPAGRSTTTVSPSEDSDEQSPKFPPASDKKPDVNVDDEPIFSSSDSSVPSIPSSLPDSSDLPSLPHPTKPARKPQTGYNEPTGNERRRRPGVGSRRPPFSSNPNNHDYPRRGINPPIPNFSGFFDNGFSGSPFGFDLLSPFSSWFDDFIPSSNRGNGFYNNRRHHSNSNDRDDSYNEQAEPDSNINRRPNQEPSYHRNHGTHNNGDGFSRRHHRPNHRQHYHNQRHYHNHEHGIGLSGNGHNHEHKFDGDETSIHRNCNRRHHNHSADRNRDYDQDVAHNTQRREMRRW